MCFIFFVTGCGCSLSSISEQAREKDREEQEAMLDAAMPMIKEYILQKYGFEVSKNDFYDVSYPCKFSPPLGCNGYSGEIQINTSYLNKAYKIYANTSNYSHFSDSYEKDILKEIVKRDLEKYFDLDYNKFDVLFKVASYDTDFENDYFYHNHLNPIVDTIDNLIYKPTSFTLVTYQELNDDIEEKISNINLYVKKTKHFNFIQTYDLNSYNEYLNIAKSKNDYNLTFQQEIKNRLVKDEKIESFF